MKAAVRQVGISEQLARAIMGALERDVVMWVKAQESANPTSASAVVDRRFGHSAARIVVEALPKLRDEMLPSAETTDALEQRRNDLRRLLPLAEEYLDVDPSD